MTVQNQTVPPRSAPAVAVQSFMGAERLVRRLSGACAVRVSHGAGRAIAAHAHDWPNLTVHLAGPFTEFSEDGEIGIHGPAAILHPPGSFHANRVSDIGLETFGLMFDPAWLPRARVYQHERAQRWIGGRAALAASALVAAWRRPEASDAQLAAATLRFFEAATSAPLAPRPSWLDVVARALDGQSSISAVALSARVGKNPAWLARAWRATTGEGLQETARRKRIEAALPLLRSTDMSLATVANEVGFCDQAHMTRCFRAVLDTTPAKVRATGGAFAADACIGSSAC